MWLAFYIMPGDFGKEAQSFFNPTRVGLQSYPAGIAVLTMIKLQSY